VKFFRILPNQISIVINIFRLIWAQQQTEFRFRCPIQLENGNYNRKICLISQDSGEKNSHAIPSKFPSGFFFVNKKIRRPRDGNLSAALGPSKPLKRHSTEGFKGFKPLKLSRDLKPLKLPRCLKALKLHGTEGLKIL